jgi:hypothetical protein
VAAHPWFTAASPPSRRARPAATQWSALVVVHAALALLACGDAEGSVTATGGTQGDSDGSAATAMTTASATDATDATDGSSSGGAAPLDDPACAPYLDEAGSPATVVVRNESATPRYIASVDDCPTRWVRLLARTGRDVWVAPVPGTCEPSCAEQFAPGPAECEPAACTAPRVLRLPPGAEVAATWSGDRPVLDAPPAACRPAADPDWAGGEVGCPVRRPIEPDRVVARVESAATLACSDCTPDQAAALAACDAATEPCELAVDASAVSFGELRVEELIYAHPTDRDVVVVLRDGP